jgi:hypothetical protein
MKQKANEVLDGSIILTGINVCQNATSIQDALQYGRNNKSVAQVCNLV